METRCRAAGTDEFYGPDGALSQGIAVMHVVDGKVDEQVGHYTPLGGEEQPPVDRGTGVLSVGHRYCKWDKADVKTTLSMMSADSALHTARDFVGTEEVRTFIETLPYEIRECSLQISTGDWQAVSNTFGPREVDEDR